MSFSKQAIRAALADAALAVFVALIFGSLVASLAAAGTITMGLAIFFLCVVFVLAMVGTFVLDHLFRFSWKLRGVFALALLAVLGATGWYEWSNYEKPLSRQDLAEILAKIAEPHLVPNAPEVGAKDQEEPTKTAPSGELYSTLDRVIVACLKPSPNDAADPRSREEQRRKFKDAVEAYGDTIGLDMTVEDIRAGLRIVVEPKTPEAKQRLAVKGIPAIQRINLELRRVGNSITATFAIVWANKLMALLQEVIPEDAQGLENLRKIAAKLIGVEASKCRVI